MLVQTYRNMRNQVNKENKELKKSYFNREIERVDGGTKRTWNVISKLTNEKSKTTEIPYLEIDRQTVTDPLTKVEKLNDYFSTIKRKLNENTSFANSFDESSMNRASSSRFRFYKVARNSVLKAIGRLKSKR